MNVDTSAGPTPGTHLTRSGSPLAADPRSLDRFFGASEGLLSLWIAEPYLPLAPPIVAALEARAADGWFGYETRPEDHVENFWAWMMRRSGWDGTALHTLVSPSIGTSIGALIDLLSDPGDGVILQPPVFTDFKPLIRRAQREPIRNSLRLDAGRYSMDLADLEQKAAEPANKVMILCNPHNPVGRVWNPEELAAVASICADSGVFVIADEIHADLALAPHQFTPFAVAAAGSEVRWAATHGPIKTFGIAGVADTLLITGDDPIAGQYRSMAGRLHLSRNNVFSLAAMRAGYQQGEGWVDALLDLVKTNVRALQEGLPEEVTVVTPEGTYLAWLDFRKLDMEVPELAAWLVEEARLALSPGHWFGREGAGFARMTIAVATAVVGEACDRIRDAVAATRG